MELIIKLLKLKITKAVLFLMTVAFFASLYVYKDWYIRQVHKGIGCYYIYQGDKAYRNAQYQRAVNMYRRGLRHYPGHSRASWNLGNIYVSFENYKEAVSAYENALKYNPDFMVCRMDMGIILAEKMADYDKAIQEYGRVVNSMPFIINIPFVYNNKDQTKANRGIAYYNMGLAYRGKAVYMADNYNIAVMYLKKAKESYKKAQKYLKNDFDNTYNLALTNHLLGDYNSAGSEYCKAININPYSFEAHYNFAFLLRTMNYNKEALAEFEKTMLLLNPDTDDVKSKYVFGVINEVKRRILNEGDYEYLKNFVGLNSVSETELNYTRGKVVSSKQKEFNLDKVLKCNISELFEEL